MRFKIVKIAVIVLMVLVVLYGACLLLLRFLPGSSNYKIENNYYGFKVSLPSGWIAQAKSIYSEENIATSLQDCSNDLDGKSAYKVGEFKFENRNNTSDSESVAAINIAVNCLPQDLQAFKNASYGGISVGGEKALHGFSDLPGQGRVEYLSFFHKGLQYIISESASLSDNSSAIKNELNGIVSSFEFLK